MQSSLSPCAAALLACFALAPAPRAAESPPDPRNFANGRPIPDESYCDQPRVVVTRDGTWVCILTTAAGEEGSAGQHVVATSSKDEGRTWSPLADVEPAAAERSSYALALVTPSDRIYAFYCYNGDAIRALPNGTPIRDDMQGWFAFRYSEDQGRTWSARHRLPLRLTAADRNNDWQGRLQMFWAIGTPAVAGRSVMFGFTKLGRYLLQDGEGWFFRSDNLLEETDPDRIAWRLLPEGDHGVRAPEFGSVQEEFDVVHLAGEDWFCVFRTALGHAGSTYSHDGGRTWEKPLPLAYTPGGRVLKQPRACAKIWKTRAGRYLLWFHHNATTTYNNGLNAGSRNVAWLSAGRLVADRLHWSQPEIVAYVDGGLEGCSYPDLIETGEHVHICATQKTEARVLAVEPALLAGLWTQHEARTPATNGLALALRGAQCAPGATNVAPRFEPLCGPIAGRTLPRGGLRGFTVEAWVKLDSLQPGRALLDTRDAGGRGWALLTAAGGALRFEMNDGWNAAFWESDRGALTTADAHHVAVIVDGGARVIAFVVDGLLGDGGAEREIGFGRFNANFKDVSGGRVLRIAPDTRDALSVVRLYRRPLRVSEVIGNWRAGGG